MPGRSDERLARTVLLVAGLFPPDEQQPRRRWSGTEHGGPGISVQITAAAPGRGRGEFVEIVAVRQVLLGAGCVAISGEYPEFGPGTGLAPRTV